MKILLLRFSSIGDLVKFSALLERIHQEAPTLEIHFVTKKIYGTLFESDPRIHKLYLIDKNATTLTDNGKILEAREEDVLRELGKNTFDFGVDAHSSLRSLIFRIKLKRNVKKFSKLHKSRIRKYFLFLFRIPAPAYFLDQRCFNLVNELLGEPKKIYLPKLIPSPLRISNLQNHLNLDFEKCVCLIPGAAHKNKEPSAIFWNELIKKFESTFTFIIVGGANRKFPFQAKNLIDLCGKLDLMDSMIVASLAKYSIGVDTGITHAVEALGKSTNLILGPTGMETGAYPSHPDTKIFERDIFCRPCSKDGSGPCFWGAGTKRCLTLEPHSIAQEIMHDN